MENEINDKLNDDNNLNRNLENNLIQQENPKPEEVSTKKSLYAHFWNLFKILLVVIIIYILLKNTNLKDIKRTIISINFKYIPILMVIYVIIYILQAWRFKILLKLDISLKTLIPICIFQNVANMFLPARAGDISYLMLLKKSSKTPISTGMTSIILARICDIIVLGIMFVISLIFLPSDISHTIKIISATTGYFFIIILLISYIIIFHFNIAQNILIILSQLLHLSKFSITKKIHELITNISNGIKNAKNARIFIPALLLSILIWGFFYLFSFISYIYLFQLAISPIEVLYIFVVLFLLSIIPVHLFGGLGTMDASFSALLLAFSITTKSQAIAISLAARLIMYLFAGLSFFWAIFTIRKK